MSAGKVRAAIAQLAAGQWGLITAAQATQAGANRTGLTRMTATGELERVVRGVYATPAALADPHIDKRALWLTLDPTHTAEERLTTRHVAGVLSHATAAAMHQIGDILDDRVEITSPTPKQTRRPEIRLRTAPLRPDEVTLVDGLPVTTPARTIADLHRARYDRDHVAATLADALRRDLTTVEQIRAALADRLSDARAERALDELLAAAGLDEASLERAVLSSPVGQRVTNRSTTVAALALAALADDPALQAVRKITEEYERTMAPTLERLAQMEKATAPAQAMAARVEKAMAPHRELAAAVAKLMPKIDPAVLRSLQRAAGPALSPEVRELTGLTTRYADLAGTARATSPGNGGSRAPTRPDQ